MTKIFFIILLACRFAAAAEFEAVDKFSVGGVSVFQGNVGVGTSTVSGARFAVIGTAETANVLVVGTSASYGFAVSTVGTVAVESSVKIGADNSACSADNAGSISWNGRHFYGCNGSAWRQLDNAPPPLITGISPSSGSINGGTVLSIGGNNFESPAAVAVGNIDATGVVVVASTQITATTPAGLTTGLKDVKLLNPDGQYYILASTFAYFPVVAGIGPNEGPVSGNTPVTISGNGFGSGAAVAIGDSSATVSAVTATQINALTGASAAAGARDVRVTNPDGYSGIYGGGFTYRNPPSVAGVSPGSGPATGGTSVTITGSDFNPGLTVIIGNATASVTGVSSSQITAHTAQSSVSGPQDLTVRNPDGQSAALIGGFFYIGDGTTKNLAGRSCKEIKTYFPSSSNGMYWIDPNGGTTSDAFQAYCDMTIDGGGWTLVMADNMATYGQMMDWKTSSSIGSNLDDVSGYRLPNYADMIANHLVFSDVLLATNYDTTNKKSPVVTGTYTYGKLSNYPAMKAWLLNRWNYGYYTTETLTTVTLVTESGSQTFSSLYDLFKGNIGGSPDELGLIWPGGSYGSVSLPNYSGAAYLGSTDYTCIRWKYDHPDSLHKGWCNDWKDSNCPSYSISLARSFNSNSVNRVFIR